MIPNLVHFVWLTGPASRDFSFINYLAVRAARETQPDAEIWIHCNEEPLANPHWDRAKHYARVRQVAAPTEHNGVPLVTPQYQSDVLRLQILLAEGGVYLDTDTLLLKSLAPLLDNACVMSPDAPGEPTAFNAGLIMAEPGHPFLQRWFETMPLGPEWAAHITAYPWGLYKNNVKYHDKVTLVDAEKFIPFGWEDKNVLTADAGTYLHEFKYAIHMWETIWSADLAVVSDYWLRHSSSVFAKLFSKYAWRPQVCVYAIAKNEEQFVDRFCTSAQDADLILIADTGSSDGTASHANRQKVLIHDIYVSPWRFDTARNAALALIPPDIDICISLDLDEELQPGWRDAVEKAWVWGTTRLRYTFDWGAGIVFWYEKIHARHGYRWHHPCHEYPVPDRITEHWADCDHPLLVIHKPDPSKSRGQYLDLLRVSVEEDPACPRNGFYYARELSFNGHWDEAIEQAKRYLDLPRATWGNERCYAMRVISRCYHEKGDLWQAWAWAMKSTVEAPGTREPWVELAKIAYHLQRWPECYGAATTALGITDRELVYTCDPEVWGAKTYDFAAMAAWHLGLEDKALEYGEEAAKLAPQDERIVANLRLYAAVVA